MPKAKVFLSYSHRDRAWKDRLVGHLQVLEREGSLDLWDDDRIPAGADWLAEIQDAIQGAQVAVLLVSVDFLNSRFIREKEVPDFLARRKTEGLHIFPVIVGSCLWDQVREISSIQARPRDGKALASFRGDRVNQEMAEIGREILRLLVGDTEPSVSTPAEAIRPLHQLPSPPADFVGRETELTELRAEMQKGGFTICGLQGMGGVGKTALALRLAHEFRDAYPDAQIYLDLRGVSEKPVTSEEAMAHVIRAFHPETKIPEGDQLAALYREVLHSKRVLLLMDNASDRTQVDPLVPPDTCALLVTSRSRFSLPGLFRRDLDQLPENDACALLLKIAPRIWDQAATIARLCGYLPFALRVTASTLADRTDLTVSDYVHRLEKDDQKAELGAAALGLSYSLLPDSLQARFRTLAVFSVDFDLPAAAAVWDLAGKENEADEALGELVQRSLLDGEEGRYKLHDLAQAYAAARCVEGEEEEVRARHAQHFVRVLAEADELYQKGNDYILSGLARFDRELAHILAGQVWAEARIETSEIAAHVANSLPYVGAYLLDLRLPPRERIHLLEAGLAGARKLNNRPLEANHLGNLGLVYWHLGETRRAIELFEQALTITREIGNRRGEANSLGNLGLAYADLGEARAAIEYYEQVLTITREIGDRRGEGITLSNLGLAYKNLGETQRAIELYDQRLVIARELGDRRGEALVSWNLSLAYKTLGELVRAIDCMQVRVDFERQIGHPDAEKHAAEVDALRARALSV
ncbi:MAG TPA: tetratricopeptide repeat protein [Thermoanaerobaculia bacterium]|jgi:tetratricopeptide (TPR) repeat protein|nr:tetratricopeptide repeat protein [Thermoanaerobaculia bacterium]